MVRRSGRSKLRRTILLRLGVCWAKVLSPGGSMHVVLGSIGRQFLFHLHGGPQTGFRGRCQKNDQGRHAHIGRGSRQRAWSKCGFCNNFKVAMWGRAEATSSFEEHLETDHSLYDAMWSLSGCRLNCCCTTEQDFHAEAFVREFTSTPPTLFDRNEEPDSGSTADEGAELAGVATVLRCKSE